VPADVRAFVGNSPNHSKFFCVRADKHFLVPRNTTQTSAALFFAGVRWHITLRAG
jgi:hypothetical protein